MTTGDYDLRGQDYETQLVGPITDTVIDAARLARAEHDNGFPNFAMFRLILAGDMAYLRPVRQWWVLFSIEWCRSHMGRAYSEELATVAAWDSLQRVLYPRRDEWRLSAQEAADDLGVELETYTRARNSLKSILGAALQVYSNLLCATYRLARHLERKS